MSEIYGLPTHLYYGQNARVDELNNRIGTRQFPDAPLEPNYDPRPIPTKYSYFPIVNRRTPSHEPIIQHRAFHTANNFTPSTRASPFSGYASNLDVENSLRNQNFAHQPRGIMNHYIPSSDSDLYKVTVISRPSDQPHPGLFSQKSFNGDIHPNLADNQIGKEQFFNHTRTQLRAAVIG
jgi:hypothetical protein